MRTLMGTPGINRSPQFQSPVVLPPPTLVNQAQADGFYRPPFEYFITYHLSEYVPSSGRESLSQPTHI